MIDEASPLPPAAERMRRYRSAASATQAKAQGQAHRRRSVSKHNPTEGVVRMSETVPCFIRDVVTGERTVIQLKPAGGRSAAEAQAFLEGRRKEAERIDPQTCEITWGYANAVDLYGIFEDHEEFQCYGKENFVRNVPDGDDWVWEGDLPEHIHKALRERIERRRSGREGA